MGPELSNWELLFRLALATAIGAIIGYEREKNKKPAGIRTHVLISVASCMIAMISAYGFADAFATELTGVNFNFDPARLVVGVLTGIGFIGGGIIWKSPTGIIGITTAADIFFLAALGIAIGLGLYLLAAAAGLIAIITLVADDFQQLVRNRKLKKAGCSSETVADNASADSAPHQEQQ